MRHRQYSGDWQPRAKQHDAKDHELRFTQRVWTTQAKHKPDFSFVYAARSRLFQSEGKAA